MAANATFTVRMNPELKKQAELVCEEMGLTMSSAMTIFLKRFGQRPCHTVSRIGRRSFLQ